MALTITEVETNIFGTARAWIGDVTFDASYPTGGEPLTATDLGLVDVFYLTGYAAGYVLVYDHANAKIEVFQSDDAVDPLDEVGNTTDLSAVTARIFAIGR